jgi:hypothetical protein
LQFFARRAHVPELIMRDDTADADFWHRTWHEREETVRRAFGETDPPGTVVAFSWDDLRVPGACALAFPPTQGNRDDLAPRDHWLYLTLGLTQPLDAVQLRRERAAGKRYSARGVELGILTDARAHWAPGALYLFLSAVTEGDMINWGDRFAFGFHQTADGGLSVFTGHPDDAGVRPVGDIRAMLFWKYLSPRGAFVTSTGNALILIGTGITADEWELCKATTTAHVLLLLCRAGIGQKTDPERRSVSADPRWADEWRRIRTLTPEQAADELETRWDAAPNA